MSATTSADERLHIVYRPIDDLKPYERNARTHPPEQIELIKKLMLQFGWSNPVLLDGANGIIAGHGRIVAARALWAAGRAIRRCPMGQAPTIDLSGFSEAEKRAYVLADNQSALRAGWDIEMVGLELGELKSSGFDMSLTGFSTSELSRFTSGAGHGDPEVAPDPPAVPTSVLGDVWRLGRHRIVCGDSTNAAAVGAALNGAVPHLMVTDPPYGVNYDPSWRARAGVNINTGKMGVVANDNRADWREAWRLFPGRVMYVWHAGLFSSVVQQSIEACGFTIRSQIVWAKDRFALGRGNYHWQHEPCWLAVRPHNIGAGGGTAHDSVLWCRDAQWYAWQHDAAWYAVRKGKRGEYVGGRSQSTLWTIPAREDDGHGHGTQKPIECMRRPIENNSVEGDAVYEPFSGSGTTIVACEMTGRVCHALELTPAYVDVAILRWQDYTGQVALHANTGESFNDARVTRVVSAS